MLLISFSPSSLVKRASLGHREILKYVPCLKGTKMSHVWFLLEEEKNDPRQQNIDYCTFQGFVRAKFESYLRTF